MKTKMKIKRNVTILNIVSSIILEIITLINGFIVPKLILDFFGSEVNGLTSSITQFLGYVYLIEGGITGVIMSNLYKPLHEKDNKKISSIVKTSQKFYRRISVFLIVYTVILSFAYPLLVNSSFSFGYIASLICIMSTGLLIQYAFSITYKTLLNADKRVYIVSIAQTIVLVFNIIFSFISLLIFPNIHILKIISGLVFVIQPIVYSMAVKKRYDIDKAAPVDKELLKNRWSGFAINLASFIHFNTDIVILNIFTNLTTVSIYSVYNLIVSGLRQIVSAVSSAIYPSIGHIYVKGDKKELDEKFDLYELVNFVIVYFLFTVAILMATPFVELYTINVTDANYSLPILGYIMLISEMIYLIKMPHINLAYSAKKFKEMTKPSIIEVVINIVISVVLVKMFGVVGVAIGTLVAMAYRTIYQIYFLKKNIIFRNTKIFAKKIILFTIGFIAILSICNILLPYSGINIFSWIIYALLYSVISSIIYIFIVIVFYKKDLEKIIRKEKKNVEN